MNFDFGYEVFVVPIVWVGLLIAVTILLVRRKWRTAGLTILIGGVLVGSLVVVPPGHRGVIYSAAGGISPVERAEGVSFMFPVLQAANMVNVREQKYENLEVFAQTQDLLEVTVQIGVNYFIQPGQAAELFRDVGKNYELAIIEPAVLDISKRHIGLVDAIDFPTNRQAIADSISVDLTARLGQRGIQVTYVAIQDNIFDPQFVSAVLQKEIADELAARSERLVAVATNDAEATRQTASGDADAIALKGEGEASAIAAVSKALGFTSNEYLSWLQLNRWDGVLPDTLVGDSGNFNILLGVN